MANKKDLTEGVVDAGYLCSKYEQVGSVGVILLIVVILGIGLCSIFLKTKRNNYTMLLAKSTHSAYGHLLLAFIGIFWASIVSVFGSQLQLQWFGKDSWGTENLLFGIPVTLALVLSVLHYIYSQHKEQQSHSRPSHDAINENSVQCVHMSSITNSCIQDLRKIVTSEINCSGSILGDDELAGRYSETLDNAIEAALNSILTVTRGFIEGNDEVHIKSNIFNLIPAQSALKAFSVEDAYKQDNNSIFSKGSVEKSPFFLFSTNLQSRLEHCDYVLACEQTFTCELNKKNIFSNCFKKQAKGFKDTHPICMPVSFDTNDVNSKVSHPNLFGAPQAITSQREVYVENISVWVDKYIDELKKSPRYREHMTGFYEQSIREYYEKDKDKPKSILSIPIEKLEIDLNKLDVPKSSEQFGCVLNIYVDRTNFLENEIKSETYYSMLKPLCHNLSVLISLKILYSRMIKDYNSAKNHQQCNQSQEVVHG